MSCMQGGAGCACPLRPNLSGIPVNFKLVLRCVRLYEHSPCVSPHFPAFPPCSQEVSPLRIQGQVTDKLLIFFHLHDWLLLSQIPHLVDTTQQIPILMHRKTKSADDFFTWEQKILNDIYSLAEDLYPQSRKQYLFATCWIKVPNTICLHPPVGLNLLTIKWMPLRKNKLDLSRICCSGGNENSKS